MKTIIFGAGASFPFYETHLSTRYLNSKINDIDSWINIINKYQEINDSSYPTPTPSDINDVISTIMSYMPNANFEQVAEVIDKISSYGYDHLPCNNMLNLLFATCQVSRKCNPSWNHVPFFFREIIANAIIDSEKNHKVPHYNELQLKQQNFIRAIKDSSENKMSVISLNYDDCVPTSIDNIEDIEYCFSAETLRHNNELNVQEFISAHYVAYFPHGHLRFVFNDEQNVTYYSNIYEAENDRWKGLDNNGVLDIVKTPFSYDFNTFLTTGQTKDSAFNNMPYAVYYQRLAKDLLESKEIYLIGYSFGDLHFNRLLKAFLLLDKSNIVYIIDKYDDTITMTDEYQDENNIITKIQQVFSPEWKIVFDRDTNQKIAFNEKEVNKINDIGYGEIFDQIVFYKKGYEEFLNEYNNVIL